MAATRNQELEWCPEFNGDDVEGWKYRCEQFFLIDETPENYKVRYAAIKFEGKALHWYQLYRQLSGKELIDMTWDDFSRSTVLHFGGRPEMTGIIQETELPFLNNDVKDLVGCVNKAEMESENVVNTHKVFDEMPEKGSDEIQVQISDKFGIGNIINTIDEHEIEIEEANVYENDKSMFGNEERFVKQNVNVLMDVNDDDDDKSSENGIVITNRNHVIALKDITKDKELVVLNTKKRFVSIVISSFDWKPGWILVNRTMDSISQLSDLSDNTLKGYKNDNKLYGICIDIGFDLCYASTQEKGNVVKELLDKKVFSYAIELGNDMGRFERESCVPSTATEYEELKGFMRDTSEFRISVELIDRFRIWETPLQLKLNGVAPMIGSIGLFFAVSTFAVLVQGLFVRNMQKGPHWNWFEDEALEMFEYFDITVTIVVVVVPEGLPLAVTWWDLVPNFGTLCSDPIRLRVAGLGTVPIPTAPVLQIVCRSPFLKSCTQVIDGSGNEILGLKMREMKRIKMMGEKLRNEVIGITREGETVVLRLGWSLMDSLWSLQVQKNGETDVHLPLSGPHTIKLIPGRNIELDIMSGAGSADSFEYTLPLLDITTESLLINQESDEHTSQNTGNMLKERIDHESYEEVWVAFHWNFLQQTNDLYRSGKNETFQFDTSHLSTEVGTSGRRTTQTDVGADPTIALEIDIPRRRGRQQRVTNEDGLKHIAGYIGSKEIEFKKFIENVAASGESGSDDAGNLERKESEFLKILEVGSIERDRLQRIHVIDSVAVAIAGTSNLLKHKEQHINVGNDDQLYSGVTIDDDYDMDNGVIGDLQVKGSAGIKVLHSAGILAIGISGPNSWSWLQPASTDFNVSNGADLALSSKISSSPSQPNPVMELGPSISHLSLPFEGKTTSNYDPPLSPFQSLMKGEKQNAPDYVESLQLQEEQEIASLFSTHIEEAAHVFVDVDPVSFQGTKTEGSMWWKETGGLYSIALHEAHLQKLIGVLE